MKLEVRPELKLIADSLRKLKEDGVIRTKNLVGDLGESYCRDRLDVDLNTKVNETGFDATDSQGKKVEIKTRRLPENRARVSFRSLDFDYCLYVELNEFFEPMYIYKISRDDLIANLEEQRNRLSVGKLKSIQSKEQVYP